MKKLQHDDASVPPRSEALKDELYVRLAGLDERQLDIVRGFIEQVLSDHDPDVVESFLEWRMDPDIGSILQIATSLSGEAREQLLFAAEEIYSSEARRH